MASYDAQREELFTIKGDPIAGGGAMDVHLSRSKAGSPKIRYGDFVIEADVYMAPGAPVEVHLFCPRCRNALRITSDRKAIEYDPRAGAPQDGGRISIEAFECTWELEPQKSLGAPLCRWRVGVINNRAVDA